MAYFALLWKARTIEKYRSKYEKEKIDSIIAANAELPRHTFCQKWKLYRYDSEKKLNRTFRRWCPEGSRVSNFFVYLSTDQTFANFLLKSVIGFVGGIVLTYFWFMFFVFQLSISLIHATIMSSIIGVSLTLGLAFSYRVRCLVFLLIPQFFSRVGRYTLTCYALVLILTGPATNTLKNSEVLSESLACGQEQVKTSVSKISKSMEKPLHLVKDTIDETMTRLKHLAAKVKELMLKIHRLTMSLAHVLQSSLAWLNSVEDICNAKLGSPYEHCIKILNHEKPVDKTKGLLNLDHFVKAVCFNLKSVDSMCVVGEFAKSSIVATVRKKLQTYSDRVRSVVSVNVRLRRSHGCCNASREAAPTAGVVTEIRHRADPLLTWLSWSSCLTSLFLLLIIFRAKYYQQMFETRSRFDNRYVTKELRDLDLKRLRQGRETVLPLNTRERAKYVSTTSFRLLSSERVHLTRSIVFMVITTFKLLIHMVADYSLYWVLMNIRFHGRFQTPLLPGDPTAGIEVSGSGPLAGIVRVLVEALSVPLAVPAPSPLSCLPNPHPPDFQRYAQIGVLILLLWMFALFEPYGLRLRHVIMSHYRPERARARAEWLYNHIIRTRGCFLKYARRKLHREYKYSSEERYTFKRWLGNFITCRCLRFLLRIEAEEPHCLLCGTQQIQNDSDTYLKRCETPSCPGTYCARCFTDIGQLCTICLSPEDYGDLSDVSLEKSSSEDSDSDDDSNQNGANKPLLGRSANKINENDNISHQNTTTNRCERLSKPKNNPNWEAKNDSSKQKDNADSNFYKEISTDNEKSEREIVPVVVRDKDRFLKSVDVPIEKLAGVINTMKLLTTKIEDNKYNSQWNMHESKTFEYLVMNLMEPVDTFKKALVVRQAKHIDNCSNSVPKKESMRQLIPFLCNYSINDTMPNNIFNDPIATELSTYFKEGNANKTYAVSDENVINKYNTESVEGNMSRSLEPKTSLEDFIGRLRRRRIGSFTNFIYKKQRLNHYACFVIKTSFRPQIKAKFRIYSINKSRFSKNLPLKHKNNLYIDNNMECLSNDSTNIQGTKCPEIIRTQQMSNDIVTDCSSNIKPSDLKDSKADDEPKQPNAMTNEENIENKVDQITDFKINEKHCRNRGFYSRLWMHTKKTLTKHKLSKCIQKREPILPNNNTNHKRRKKCQVLVQKETLNTSQCIVAKQDNDDARNFRISLYLKDNQEWFKEEFQKESNNDIKTEKRQPNEKINNFLIHLKDKTEKRKMKEAEIKKKMVQKELVRQLKLKAKAEEKVKRMLKKDTIKHKGNKTVVLKETLKAIPGTVSNKKEIDLIKDVKTTVISSAKLENNDTMPVVEETSLKEKRTYASPLTCVSNCLNFFDFNQVPIDLPDDDIDLDEIFADVGDEWKVDLKEINDEMTYHHKGRKHPQRPLLWPGNRSHISQTLPEDVAVAKEKRSINRTCSKIKDKTPTTNKCTDPDKSFVDTKDFKCNVKLDCDININNRGIKTSRKIIRLKSQDDIIDNEQDDKTKKTYLEEYKSKTNDKGSTTKLYDFNRKRNVQNETFRLKKKDINENGQRQRNIICPTSKDGNTQATLLNTAMVPTTESNKNGLEAKQSNQKNKKCIFPVRFTASELIHGMKSPVDKLKDFYGTLLFGGSKGEKGVFTSISREQKSLNKKIQAPRIKLKNCHTQYENGCSCHCPCEDQKVGTAVTTEDVCTCAAQCSVHQKYRVNVGTIHHNALKKMLNKETQYERLTSSPKEGSGSSVSSTSSQVTIQRDSEEAKTDTTVCSVVKVDCAIQRPNKHRKRRVRVVTRTNQSTLTENVQSVDVSTDTSDWWSPIVEKKVPTRNRRLGTKNLERREKTNREMETDGKFVSFKSYAQIIPAGNSKMDVKQTPDRDDDIMTPCRYLVESQKYYNELFCTGPCYQFPVKVSIAKEGKESKNLVVGHRVRKSHKSKRLEECYSPRKKLLTSHLNLTPVTWRPADRKDSISLVLKRNRIRNAQAGRKSRKMRDSQDKEIDKTLRRSERLKATRSFASHDGDTGQCKSTSSY